jgi:hypothetical protein
MKSQTLQPIAAFSSTKLCKLWLFLFLFCLKGRILGVDNEGIENRYVKDRKEREREKAKKSRTRYGKTDVNMTDRYP